MVNFSGIWTKYTKCWEILKYFDKDSLEKLNFYIFLEKLLRKIEPSEITSFLYIFSISGVGMFHVFPPGCVYDIYYYAQGSACKWGRRVGGSEGLSPPDAGEVFKKIKKINAKSTIF